MKLTRLLPALTIVTFASCTEALVAGVDTPAPVEEATGDGLIMRYGPRIVVDSLYPVAFAEAWQSIMPHRIPAWNGYFLCITRNGFVRREIETVTHDGAEWLRVYPMGCTAVGNSTRK